MRKKFFPKLIALIALQAIFVSTFESKDVARLKYSLPELRNISTWKSRAGLTRFSPDGQFLAVSGKSTDVVVYSVATGEVKSSIDGSRFKAFSFTDDGKFAVAQDVLDESIHIYDSETGKLVRDFRGLGKMSVINRTFGGSGLRNAAVGATLSYLEMVHVPVSRDWRNVLVNKNDKEFALYDFSSGELRFNIDHEKYSGGWETAKLAFVILGMAGGSPVGLLLLGSSSNAQFSSDGKVLMIANGNKTPTLWNVETGNLIAKLDAGKGVFHSRLCPKGKMVATSDISGVTKIWNVENSELISTIDAKKERGFILDWNKDGDKILTYSVRSKEVRIHDITGKSLHTFKESRPMAILQTVDSTLVLTVPNKNKKVLFEIWDMGTGMLKASAPRMTDEKSPVSVKFNPHFSILALTSGIKNRVELWNLSGERVQILENASMPMEFSRDGKYLATGGKLPNKGEDTGYLWELSTNPSTESLDQ